MSAMRFIDDDINVATVEPRGRVRVWGHSDEEGRRYFISERHFPNYGQAKLWADEYEDGQRLSRPVGRR